jgi:hypothetical protein
MTTEKNMRTAIGRFRSRYSDFRDNLSALEKYNITIKQMPFLLKEWRLWLQVTRNFKEIEGSWSGALRRYVRMFTNRPERKNNPF